MTKKLAFIILASGSMAPIFGMTKAKEEQQAATTVVIPKDMTLQEMNTQLSAAIKYYESNDHKQAIATLEPLVEQTNELAIQARAARFAGALWYYAGDFNKARPYLELAANQSHTPSAAIDGERFLGLICYNGDKDNQPDYAAATNHLKKIIHQTERPEAQMEALTILGHMNLLGGHGIEQKFSAAVSYLEIVAKQSNLPIFQATANCYLGYIYYRYRQFDFARLYLKPAIEQTHHLVVQTEAQKILAKIKQKESERASA